MLKYKYYSKWIKTCHNGNVHFHNQEQSKVNRPISANSCAHTLIHDKITLKTNNKKQITQSPFNKNNVANKTLKDLMT